MPLWRDWNTNRSDRPNPLRVLGRVSDYVIPNRDSSEYWTIIIILFFFALGDMLPVFCFTTYLLLSLLIRFHGVL